MPHDDGGALDAEETTGPSGNCDVTAIPPGVPFQVTLHRDYDYESRIFAQQNLQDGWKSLRPTRIAEALARKCPKLHEARKEGCASVLILESDDIGLDNRYVVVETMIAELETRNDSPDIVFWARTSTSPWKGWFIKDGSKQYPNISSIPLFELRL